MLPILHNFAGFRRILSHMSGKFSSHVSKTSPHQLSVASSCLLKLYVFRMFPDCTSDDTTFSCALCLLDVTCFHLLLPIYFPFSVPSCIPCNVCRHHTAPENGGQNIEGAPFLPLLRQNATCRSHASSRRPHGAVERGGAEVDERQKPNVATGVYISGWQNENRKKRFRRLSKFLPLLALSSSLWHHTPS